MSTTLELPMGRKTENTSVKLSGDVWRKLKIISTALGVSIQDYASDKLRPLLAKDYAKALQILNEEADKDKDK